MNVRAHVDENLRRVSARVTRQIVLRQGTELGMVVGAGYPKSGTVWLCQLMANYLGVPYPQNYLSPIAMKSVVHAHWRWDARLPPSGYIIRDGRDVMTSFYFFHMRALRQDKNPGLRRRLQAHYDHLLGPGFDPADSRANMARFIESTMQKGPATHGVPWHQHVREWAGTPRSNVGVVRYEDLLADTATNLGALMAQVTGEAARSDRAEMAAARFDFEQTTGRRKGVEDVSSFQRKGISGDWRNHFTEEAGSVFDRYAGDVLVQFGYEKDRSWFHQLER